jgi:hypothetical protein
MPRVKTNVLCFLTACGFCGGRGGDLQDCQPLLSQYVVRPWILSVRPFDATVHDSRGISLAVLLGNLAEREPYC